MKKYNTDIITNILCNYYNNNIEEDETIKKISKINKNDLAEYILDLLNRKITWEAINKID